MGRTPGLSAAVVVLLATVWLWPHLLHPRQVPDRGDPVFSAWRIARFARQLAHDPAHLFDGNIFYPRRWTLAYSDATLLQGAIGAPFVLAGADPLVVANGLFFLAFPLCGLAFFHAGRRLTGDTGAAVVAGVLGAWYPFHGEHYSHLELQWFMFAPLAFVATLDLIESPGPRRGAVLAALVVLQSLASMYLGLMLAAVLVPFALVRIACTRKVAWRPLTRATLVTALILVPVAAAIAVPYERARTDHGERSTGEIDTGSAAPGDYLKTSRRLATYAWHERAANRPERELFPGTSTLVLAAAGVVASPAAIVLPLAAAGAAAFDWSLGLHGATYRALAAIVPPFRSVRVPARFAVLLGAVLILFAARGAHALLGRVPERHRPMAAALLAAAVLFDLRLTVSLVDYYPTIPAAVGRLDGRTVLATLPAGHDVDHMYFSTATWPHLLGGYSGFIPADAAYEETVARFPEPGALVRLRDRGATHLLYTCAFERSAARCQYNATVLAGNPDVELIAGEQWMGAPLRLYRFRAGER